MQIMFVITYMWKKNEVIKKKTAGKCLPGTD